MKYWGGNKELRCKPGHKQELYACVTHITSLAKLHISWVVLHNPLNFWVGIKLGFYVNGKEWERDSLFC